MKLFTIGTFCLLAPSCALIATKPNKQSNQQTSKDRAIVEQLQQQYSQNPNNPIILQPGDTAAIMRHFKQQSSDNK